MNKLKIFLGALFVTSVLFMTGCAVYPMQYSNRGYGPPPHAPAHGYRHKYHDHDLVYDSNLGVYLVIGYPDYYFLGDSYYRHSNDGWYYSKQVDRDWQQYQQARLPPGLARKYHDNDGDRGHDNDRGGNDDHGNGKGRGHDNGHGNDRD